MAKARIDWAFGERPVASSKLDQANTDYITPGVPIWSYFYTYSVADSLIGLNTAPRGFFPYNPQKSVFDRLYIIGDARTSNSGDVTADFDLTFDGGSSWTDAFPSNTAAPVTLITSTLAEIWDLGAQVASFQWIGFRWAGTGPTSGASFHMGFLGFLYNSTDNPF